MTNESRQDAPLAEQPAPSTDEPLVFTVQLTDKVDSPVEFDLCASVSNPRAVDLPPTPAMVVGTYIVAHLNEISEKAARWAMSQTETAQ